MKYSATALIVGHNNKKPTIMTNIEQHGINWMDKQSRFALIGAGSGVLLSIHDGWRKSTVQLTLPQRIGNGVTSLLCSGLFLKKLTPITGMQLLTNVRTSAVCGGKLATFFNLWPLQSASIQLRRLPLSSATRWIAYEKQL